MAWKPVRDGAGASSANPMDARDTAEASSTVAVLRWRSPQKFRQVQKIRQVSYGEGDAAGPAEPAVHDDRIRLASGELERKLDDQPGGSGDDDGDVFSEPFGGAPSGQGSVLVAPAARRRLTQEGGEQRPGDDQPLAPQIARDQYNNRDCPDETLQCDERRDRLRAAVITKIRPDITPRFHPEEDDPELWNSLKQELLDKMEAIGDRTWKNRQGQVLATGRFTDYRSGHVVVTKSDGEVVKLRYKDLSDEDACFVAAWWELPVECALVDASDPLYGGRDFTPLTMTWKASSVSNKPLYFEEVRLERYGHTVGPILQPVASGAHFFLNVAVLPYKMGINPPTECQYPLGYYRPGNCAPWLVPPVPLSLRGAALQTGALLGGIYIIP